MTNAMVSPMVQANNGREPHAHHKGGSQQVLVPESVPIVMAVDDRPCSNPEYAFIAANVGADGDDRHARPGQQRWSQATAVMHREQRKKASPYRLA